MSYDRDEFAGLAMQGILAHYGTDETPRICAKEAYKHADAMLAESGKNEPTPTPDDEE